MIKPMDVLQPLGRALMLPIAVLPIAGLLLRLGQPDLLNVAFISAAGDAIFQNLGLLFAIGVAAGFARDANGAACLAGMTCFLVASRGAQVALIVPPDLLHGLDPKIAAMVGDAWKSTAISKVDVPLGIVSGLIGGIFYNRFSGLKLPDYLAFFGGRRFVPLASGVAGLAIAAGLGLVFLNVQAGIDAFSRAILSAGELGLFAYGVLNRLLLVTGLHHILNNVAWFVIGDYHGTSGDLRRFFAGDPTAGAFMSGFFPIMMFGLPAACLAMYHAAPVERRSEVAGLFSGLALTSFLTGVTEPIEFSFMFLAPVLFVIHAILTGLASVVMSMLGVKLGFGFSAGLLDYILNFSRATRPLLLLPVGAGYAVAYYAIFRVAIHRWKLSTPGREARESAPAPETVAHGERGAAFVSALGGRANIVEIGACMTRLRLSITDRNAVDQSALKSLGARGVIFPSERAAQIVLGPLADAVAMEIRIALEHASDQPMAEQPPHPATTAETSPMSAALQQAVGGEKNVIDARFFFGRYRIELADPAMVSETALWASGARAVAWVKPGVLHVLA